MKKGLCIARKAVGGLALMLLGNSSIAQEYNPSNHVRTSPSIVEHSRGAATASYYFSVPESNGSIASTVHSTPRLLFEEDDTDAIENVGHYTAVEGSAEKRFNEKAREDPLVAVGVINDHGIVHVGYHTQTPLVANDGALKNRLSEEWYNTHWYLVYPTGKSSRGNVQITGIAQTLETYNSERGDMVFIAANTSDEALDVMLRAVNSGIAAYEVVTDPSPKTTEEFLDSVKDTSTTILEAVRNGTNLIPEPSTRILTKVALESWMYADTKMEEARQRIIAEKYDDFLEEFAIMKLPSYQVNGLPVEFFRTTSVLGRTSSIGFKGSGRVFIVGYNTSFSREIPGGISRAEIGELEFRLDVKGPSLE